MDYLEIFFKEPGIGIMKGVGMLNESGQVSLQSK